MISIIVPTYNEESIVETTLRGIQDRTDEAECEIIVADGKSTDRTAEVSRSWAKVIISERSRSQQLNAGAAAANGHILFFLHADATLPCGALRAIGEKINYDGYDGGGFSNIFSSHNDKIKRLGRLMNLRVRDNDRMNNTLFFGDNGIFVKKSVFEALRGFREMPIMEDYDFSDRMRKQFRVVRIMQPRLIVSPRRHLKAGFVKTRLQWILIRKLYLLGVRPKLLARLYPDER